MPPRSIHNKTRLDVSDEELPFNLRNKLIPKETLEKIIGAPVTEEQYKSCLIGTVHRSYCTYKNTDFAKANERCPEGCVPIQEVSYEKREFLGDSILGVCVTDYIYERYAHRSDVDEGFLSAMRTQLVNGRTLAKFADTIGLTQYIIMSQQVEEGGGRTNFHILEDAFEALIAGVYEVRGFEGTRAWVREFLEKNVDFSAIADKRDWKDKLVKVMIQTLGTGPQFFDLESNKGNGEYKVVVKDASGTVLGIGTGDSKKAAQHDASRIALQTHFNTGK